MKTRKKGVPKTKEERPLNRSFNSQLARDQGYSDLRNTDSDTDGELSWEEDGEYSCRSKFNLLLSSHVIQKYICIVVVVEGDGYLK